MLAAGYSHKPVEVQLDPCTGVLQLGTQGGPLLLERQLAGSVDMQTPPEVLR